MFFLKSLTLVRATIISSVRRTILTPEKFFFLNSTSSLPLILTPNPYWLWSSSRLLKKKMALIRFLVTVIQWLANYDNVHLVALSWTNYRDLGLTIVVLERLSGCHQCKMPTGGHNVAITQNQNQNNLQKNSCWKLEELSFDFAEFWECHQLLNIQFIGCWIDPTNKPISQLLCFVARVSKGFSNYFISVFLLLCKGPILIAWWWQSNI